MHSILLSLLISLFLGQSSQQQLLVSQNITASSSLLSYDNQTIADNGGSGTASATFTLTGSNRACAALVIYLTAAPSAATCGGVTMTQVGTPHLISSLGSTWTITGYIAVGMPSGSTSISISGVSYVIFSAMSFANAKQTGQPDAAFAYISGVSDGSNEVSLPGTTVVNNSMIIGWYLGNLSITTSPSSNGTFVNSTAAGTGNIWRSTTNVTPAGSTSLKGQMPNSPGTPYEAWGFSIASL